MSQSATTFGHNEAQAKQLEGTTSEARKRVVFESGSDFHKEIRKRVVEYFDSSGLDRGADSAMWIKTATLLGLFGLSYGLYLRFGHSVPIVIALAIFSGFIQGGLGFSVQHDGGHGAYSKRSWVNRSMAFVLDGLGGSSYLWRWKHNFFHHTYPNIDGIDDDIAISPIARLAPTQPRLAAHRAQWIYIWALYGFLALKWHFFDDFFCLITGKINGHRYPRPKGMELVGFFAGKLLWVTWMFVIPAMVLPWSTVLLFFIFSDMVLGVVLAVVFQLAHCVEEAEWAQLPEEGQTLRTDWAEHQLKTTVDFGRGNWFLTWFVGGLNYQVVHHLFPKICHVHYPAISKMLEEVAAKHGIEYRVTETFIGSLVSHGRWLYVMGRPA